MMNSIFSHLLLNLLSDLLFFLSKNRDLQSDMAINTGNPLLSSAPVSLTALSGITTDLASQSLSFVPQENLPENSPQNNVLLPENIPQNIIGTFPGIFW